MNRATGVASAFTNMRTGERCDGGNALLAAILADATNLGLGRMAAASHGVTRDKLIWTAGAYIRPETYKAALARIIDAHHASPIATIWGDGSTSSSDRQFFRSAKRGDAAGEVNARYGHDPGLGFYTHVSNQHGPYSARVMSATSHEAPYSVLHLGRRSLGIEPPEAPLRRADLPWLAAVILAGGVIGPVLLMVGVSVTPAGAHEVGPPSSVMSPARRDDGVLKRVRTASRARWDGGWQLAPRQPFGSSRSHHQERPRQQTHKQPGGGITEASDQLGGRLSAHSETGAISSGA